MTLKLAAPVLLLFLAPILAAQPLSQSSARSDWGNLTKLTAGDEIRVIVAARGGMRARFEGVTNESLIVNTAGKEESLDRASVASVAAKGESHRRRNALIGLGVGAGTGLALGAVADAHPCGGSRDCLNIFPNFGKEVGTPVGAVIGLTVGALLPTGGWHDIYRSRP
jgi:hypothetical protein